MSKGKKNLIVLIVALMVVGGLAGVYIWQGNRQAAEAEVEASPAPAAETLLLIDRDENDLNRVAFTTADRSLTLTADRTGEETVWQMDGDEDIAINQTTAKDMVRGLHYLSVVEKVYDQVDNPADFGFGSESSATAVCEYTDGTSAVVRIGMMTPAKDRYYLMMDGDPALYLLYTYYGDRYFNDAGSLIDKTIPTFASENIEYVLIAERDKKPIEFGFYGTEDEKQETYDQFGMIYVTMLQPYPGRELYYSNFERMVLTDFASFQPGEMVALRPDDYAPYGLDNPSLELLIRDLEENELHLFFGDRTDDGLIYFKFGDRPHVFTAEYDMVKMLYNIDVFSFIEKFVALINIEECVSIDIATTNDPARNYSIQLNHVTLPPEEGEEEGEKIIEPLVNGQQVQDMAFRTFYQRLIGLSYDTEIEPMEPEGEPVFTVTYTLKDKPPVVTKYYNYINNFYAVQRDDNPVQFVSNQHSTEIMYQSMLDLLDGKLDRD